MIAVPVFATWIALQSPHFELVTDTGAKMAGQLLANLERIRVALAPGTGNGNPLPVRVVVFRRPEKFIPYRPTRIASAFFQSGPDRDYIVASVNDDGRFPLPALFHEYVHLVLHHTTPVLPKWLDEGMAEYYSTIEFTANGAHVGKPITRHVETLRRGGWMPPLVLANVKPRSEEHTSELQPLVGISYAVFCLKKKKR